MTADGARVQLDFREPGRPDGWFMIETRGVATSVLLEDRVPELVVPEAAARREIDAALAAGKAVVWTDREVAVPEVRVDVRSFIPNVEGQRRDASAKLPAHYIVADRIAPAQEIVPTALSEPLGVGVATESLVLTGDITRAEQKVIDEQASALSEGVSVNVERGYQRSQNSVVLLLVLGVLGGVLMLGGTLTATFLALSDARADLATLSAVGASPHTRRRVAASYALVVGFVGALLGAGVGLIPGIAVSRPLTMMRGGVEGPVGPYLDIPWLLIGSLVLALPLVTAAVVGLPARSRLPLVARLD